MNTQIDAVMAFEQGAMDFNDRGLSAVNPFNPKFELTAYLEWKQGWRAAQALWYESMGSVPAI